MITDTEEIAKRLRIEAGCRHDCNEDDTLFDMSDCNFTESALNALGMDSMENMDMPVYELFDKLADLIDSQGC